MKLPPASLYLRAPAQRPAEGVDDPVERLRHLPDLLHPELPRLRVGAVHVEVVVGGVGEVADRALGEDRRLRDHVRAGLEVAELLAVLAAAAIAGADAFHDPVLDQELGRRGLGEDVDARLFGLFREEAAEFRDRERVGPLFAEVGRGRLQRERFLRGEEVGRVLRHLLVDRRPIARVEVREQPGHRRGIDVGPGEQVRAGDFALLDHRHRDFAELLGQLRLVLEQLHQFDRAGEPGGPAADDRDADLYPLILGIRGRADDIGAVERRREL